MRTLLVLMVSMTAGFLLTMLAAEAATWRTDENTRVAVSEPVSDGLSGDTGMRLVDQPPESYEPPANLGIEDRR